MPTVISSNEAVQRYYEPGELKGYVDELLAVDVLPCSID